MHFGIARLVAAGSMTALLGGCDQEPPVAPIESDVAFVVSAAGGLGSNELTSFAGSPGSIDLVWQDNSRNETGFEIQRSTTGPGGAFIIVRVTAADVTGYTDAGVTAETEYCYRVRAFRTTGRKTSYSEFSNTACTRAIGPPSAPSNANATPASTTAIDVVWRDQSATEIGFRVERSATSTGPWETIANVAANVTSFRDEGRPGEQQACYRAIAFNEYGSSAASNADCTSLPAAPTSLVAMTPFPGFIELRWTDNSAVEDGYVVERSMDGVTFTTLVILSADSWSYFDFAAPGGMTLWYRVRAAKDGGFSGFSNVVSAALVCELVEICFDGIDNDCDGLVDEECTCDHEGCGAE